MTKAQRDKILKQAARTKAKLNKQCEARLRLRAYSPEKLEVPISEDDRKRARRLLRERQQARMRADKRKEE